MEAQAAAKLIVGPAGSGKTAAALAEYRHVLGTKGLGGMSSEVRRRGHQPTENPCPRGRGHATPKVLWLAPTFAAAQDVREALVQDAGDAFLDPGVTTFAGLAAAVIREAGLRLRTVSSLAHRRLLGRVVAAAVDGDALQHFRPVATTPGFLALVEDWIADRQRREPPPKSRRSAAPQTTDPRRRDLELIYARYHAHLATANLCDRESILWAARDALERLPSVAAGLELVVADGFTDFTAAEEALLRTLAARSRRMWVTLVGDLGLGAGDWGSGSDFEPPLPRREGTGEGPATVASAPRLEAPPQSGDPPRTPPCKGGGFREHFAKTRATATRLQDTLGAEIIPLPAQDGPWAALGHLERNLFRTLRDVEPPSAAAVATAERLHIVAASGVQAEIEEIARRVKQLLIAGARPGDVVVAFRSTRDLADRIRQAFADFGVPLWLDAPRPLSAAPLVRNLQAALRLAADDWSYRRVLAVAGNESVQLFDSGWHALRSAAGRGDVPSDSSTPFADSGSATPENLRSAIELCVRHAQLPSGKRALLEQLAAWATDENRLAAPSPATAALAAAALASLAEWLDALPQRTGLAAWIAVVETLARQLGLFGATDAESVWAKLAGALHDVARIDAAKGDDDATLSLDDFADLAASVAAQLPAPDPYDTVGRVRVLSAEAARFTRPRHLFLAGLSEESFAGRRRVELDEQPDASRQRLGDSAADEMLLFYQVVARPTETLTLSYPALDEKAQQLVPSPMVAELERCFGDNAIGRTVQALGCEARESDAVLSRRDLRRAAVRQAIEGRRELLAQLGPTILDGIEAVASRARRDEFGAFEGIIDSEATRQFFAREFGADHLWSPSQLETYAECPFKFFGRQALQLTPAPELALASDFARRGQLLHEVLAQLYAELTAEGALSGAEAADAAQVLAEQFRAMVDQVARVRPGRGLDAAMREIERRQIAAWAERLALQHAAYHAGHQHLDAPLTPTYFEASFGPRNRRSESTADAVLSTPDPFELTVPVDGGQERVMFGGQIDRIDVGRVGDRTVFNVIDYKSGRTIIDQAKIESGKQLQLALYAMAAEHLLLADQQAAPLSASYWPVGGKGAGGFALGGRGAKPLQFNQVREGAVEPAPGWDRLRGVLVQRVGELIAAIRGGKFPVFNDDEGCTKFCELRTICRIAQVRSLEKSWPPAPNLNVQREATTEPTG